MCPEELETWLGIPILHCEPCGEARHVFTHVEWHMQGYLAECGAEAEGFLWKTAAEIAADYPIPTAFRYFKKIMLAGRQEKQPL